MRFRRVVEEKSRRSMPSFNNRNNTGGLWGIVGGGWERVIIRRRREIAQLVNAPMDE